jgi:hypothetical protein
MSKFELLVYWLMTIPLVPVLVLFSCLGLVIGFFLAINPVLAIEIQKRFYAKINWRMEPISMEKELRNTKIMGCALLVICLLMLATVLIKGRILL